MALTFTIHRVAQIDSTNTQLLRWANERDCHGEVLVTAWQSAGRGQRGRRFETEAGAALLFSVAWRFASDLALDGLSLAVGVMIVESLSTLLGDEKSRSLSLKWPNDLLWDNQKKLGGILIETTGSAAAGRTAVIGIGINLHTPTLQPGSLVMPVIGLNESLALSASDVLSTDTVLATVLPSLSAGLEQFARYGFNTFQERWWQRRSFADQRVQAQLPDGQLIHGHIHSLTESGALTLATEDSSTTLYTLISGEVRLRAASA